MLALWSYLRRNRWQRRLLTASLALVLGGAAAVLAVPHVRDYLLLRDLGSADYAVRTAAIRRGIQLAAQSPRTVRRLDAALADADDRTFLAIVTVLKLSGQWAATDRGAPHRDRLRAIELETNPSPETRALFLAELALTGRDGASVRRGLAAAVQDAAPAVREGAAVLAARLGGDDALARLLADEDPNVAAAAALDAGLARRTTLAGQLAKLLHAGQTVDVISAAAFALARTDPNAAAAALPGALAAAGDNAQTRARLLYVACELGGPAGKAAVLDALGEGRRAGRLPTPAALSGAARLRLAAAGPDVRNVLAAACRAESGVLIGQVHAALLAACALDLPVRAEVDAICRTLWRPDPAYRVLLAAAARTLGQQAALLQNDPNAPSEADCIRTLRMAAVQDYEPTTWPAGTKPRLLTTPLPSTAAAAALWRLESPLAEEFVARWAGASVSLPGDFLSWELGRRGEGRAFELGLRFVPPLDAPRTEREYNDDRRSTGAMLLALAARSDEQKARARQRIRARLEGGDLGGEDSFYVRGAYHCALAILGDAASRTRVAGLLETGQFSQRRAITALTVAGSLRGLDWMLWNPQVGDDDLLFLLIDEGLGDVLATCLPELPRVDPAAGTDLQAFQLRILRDAYVIRRPHLRPTWPPKEDVPGLVEGQVAAPFR